MSEAEAQQELQTGFAVFDATKVWPEARYEWRPLGELRLTRNPENYFAEVEQAAFAPGHTVPGIGLSPDRLLQARVFAYPDAQRYRLGVNYQQLAVNRPHAPVRTDYRDGAAQMQNGSPGVSPSSGHAEPAPQSEPPFNSTGDSYRYDPAQFSTVHADDFTQPGEYFRSLTPDARARLMQNLAEDLAGIAPEIRQRQLELFARVDAQLCAGIESAIQAIAGSRDS